MKMLYKNRERRYNKMEIKDIQAISQKMKENVGKVIIGKSQTIDFIITAMIVKLNLKKRL